MIKKEYLAMLSKVLKNSKPPDEVDMEELNRRIEAQFALVEEMRR
jgi:hypothetical protein